ncbi:MAG: ArsR/SmtB family transcription factor [Hyphomicrobiaceae bacterium]
MDTENAVRALGALASPHRLEIFRRLVAAGDAGATAGELADAAGIAATGLSFHIKELERADLVDSERQGRFIRYRLNVAGMRALLTFLTEDCCGGRPELCGVDGDAAGELATCCPPVSQSSNRVTEP